MHDDMNETCKNTMTQNKEDRLDGKKGSAGLFM